MNILYWFILQEFIFTQTLISLSCASALLSCLACSLCLLHLVSLYSCLTNFFLFYLRLCLALNLSLASDFIIPFRILAPAPKAGITYGAAFNAGNANTAASLNCLYVFIGGKLGRYPTRKEPRKYLENTMDLGIYSLETYTLIYQRMLLIVTYTLIYQVGGGSLHTPTHSNTNDDTPPNNEPSCAY